jgi:predicted small lipoprotein YifL
MKMHRILGGALAPVRVAGCMALIALGAAGAGCGQKGPLYLPSAQPDARSATPKPANTAPNATEALDETPPR